MTPLVANSLTLQREMTWLNEVLDTRFRLYFGQPVTYTSIYQIPAPDLTFDHSPYAQLVRQYSMGLDERLIMLLALAPHICPQVLDIFFTRNENYARGFTEFGGLKGNQHSGFLPTGETAAFVLAANDLTHRFRVLELLDQDHYLMRQKILALDSERSNEPILSGALTISREHLSLFTSGAEYRPPFSSEFPASRLSTRLEWEDLVLDDATMDEIHEIMSWIRHQHQLMSEWGLGRMIKPGYRTLFYGPPGTGKTLTASLLGKSASLDVYRVDLSKVVSKYIGETEKNLANIFDRAENKQWILFFDEADALFGKRTANSDAKDRYANQEVAYLLQRIEDFPGVVILASNLKSNIDEAFARRFQSMIYFPMPRPEHRLQLWQKAFQGFELGPGVDLKQIAQRFELAGGAIINVLRVCSLKAVERGGQRILLEDLMEGIRKEFRKEGKTV